MTKNLKEERLGATNYNKQGDLMKVVEYNRAVDIVVEFQDEYKKTIHTNWSCFIQGSVTNPIRFTNRLGQKRINTQGCTMKVIEYSSANNIIIEFQDEYKYKVQTTWDAFLKGAIKNAYFPHVCGVGIIGSKYCSHINKKEIKEYRIWHHMLTRCFDKQFKEEYPTYQDVTCCKEWLLFETFYEWIHKQENFETWLKTDRYCLDKDILIKGNKIYSPNTCCLVPEKVNTLFINAYAIRGTFPIGVCYIKSQPIKPYATYMYRNNKHCFLGSYKTPEEAFQVYKQHKEAYIKQVAQEEYNKGTISKKCYEAMMRWEVEIDD